MPCRFVGETADDGHLLGGLHVLPSPLPSPPLVQLRETPGFPELIQMDKTHWPRCLLWHGWLPALSGSSLGFLGPPHLMTSLLTNLSG